MRRTGLRGLLLYLSWTPGCPIAPEQPGGVGVTRTRLYSTIVSILGKFREDCRTACPDHKQAGIRIHQRVWLRNT